MTMLYVGYHAGDDVALSSRRIAARSSKNLKPGAFVFFCARKALGEKRRFSPVAGGARRRLPLFPRRCGSCLPPVGLVQGRRLVRASPSRPWSEGGRRPACHGRPMRIRRDLAQEDRARSDVHCGHRRAPPNPTSTTAPSLRPAADRARTDLHFVTWRVRRGVAHLSPDERGRVRAAINHCDAMRYEVHAAVVMDDHVHVLLTLLADHTLSRVLHTWKSFTAHELQKLGRRGSVWQDESFDRTIFSAAEPRAEGKVHRGESDETMAHLVRLSVGAVCGHVHQRSVTGGTPAPLRRTISDTRDAWPPSDESFRRHQAQLGSKILHPGARFEPIRDVGYVDDP